MPDASPLHVLFLTAGDGPPPAVVALAAAPGVELQGMGLEHFLAGLEAGTVALPDALLFAGADALALRLRRHPLSACLPLFRWGPEGPAAPGLDGVLLHLNPTVQKRICRWREALGGSFAAEAATPAAAGSGREAAFRRWLWSRGAGRAEDAVAFGLTAAHAYLRQWEAEGWLQAPAQRGGYWRRREGAMAPIASPATAADATPAELATVPAATSGDRATPTPTPTARPGRASWLLSAALLLVVGAMWWWWPKDGTADADNSPLAQGTSPAATASAAPTPGSEPASEPIAEASWRPTAAPLPELHLVGRLSWQFETLNAAIAGHLEPWQVAAGQRVNAGEVLGWLRREPAAASLSSLESQRQELQGGLDQALEESRRRHAATGRQAQERLEQARQRLASLRQRRPEVAAAYDKAKALADEGVLAYRQIRSEYQALVELDEALDQAETEVAAAQQNYQAWEREPWQAAQVAPALRAQLQAVELAIEAARQGPAREALLAPASGWWLPQLEAGAEIQAGQLLGRIQLEEHAVVELLLPTSAWSPAYLDGSARLRRQAEQGPWMPTRIEAATSRPDGNTLLELRLPVGWLTLDAEQHGQETWLLECRLSAPVVPGAAEESQPQAAASVESGR